MIGGESRIDEQICELLLRGAAGSQDGIRRDSRAAAFLDAIETRGQRLQHEGRTDVFAIDAKDHGIVEAAFAIGGGPKLANDKMAGARPAKQMIEPLQALLGIEFAFLPCTGID